MTSMLTGYAFAALAALISLAGDYVIKLAADRHGTVSDPYFIAGVGIYGLAAFGWLFALKNIRLAEAGVAYAMFTILATVALASIAFKEDITTRDLLGIACALGAVALLARFA